MNHFHIVCGRAAAGRLPESVNSYYASTQFRERVQFDGTDGVADRVAILLYMLQRVSLDPRGIQEVLAWLDRGYVLLHFFGVCNPVNSFDLPAGSSQLETIKAAVQANLAGPLFDAAKRVLKWREPARAARHHRMVDRIVRTLSASLPWPARETWSNKNDTAQTEYGRMCELLRAREKQLRDRRQARLRILSRAAAPGLTSWTEFLEEVTLDALAPPTLH